VIVWVFDHRLFLKVHGLIFLLDWRVHVYLVLEVFIVKDNTFLC